jgi:anti-sigma factor RsiW
MKTCQDTSELLSDYLEGQLSKDESKALSSHIGDCPACEAFIKSFKLATEATRGVLMKQIPQDFDSRLQKFLKERITKG